MNAKYAGHVALLGANTCWGLMAPISKDLLNIGTMSPWALAGIRFLGGAALFWLLSVILPKSWAEDAPLDTKDLPRLALASMLIIAGNQTLVMTGMSLTSPVDATVMCCTSPIITLLCAMLFIKERLTILKAAGVALGFCGVLGFVLGGETNEAMHVTNPVLGNSLVLCSQVCGALYLTLFRDLIAKYSPFTMMKWMFLISAIVMTPFTFSDIAATNVAILGMTGLLDAAYIVVFGTCVAYMLIPFAQRRVAPTVVAMYNYWQPIVATIVAICMGLAVLNPLTLLYAALIFSGVALVSRN